MIRTPLALIGIVILLLGCTVQPMAVTPTVTMAVIETPKPFPTIDSRFSPTKTSEHMNTQRLAAEGQEIDFWHSLDGEGRNLIDELVQSFNSANPDQIIVTSRFIPQGKAFDDALLAAQSASSLPSIVLAPPEQVMYWGRYSIQYVDLNPYIQNPEYGISMNQVSDYDAPVWNAVIYNNQITGLPITRNAPVLFYNKSWAEALGFDQIPSSFDTLEDQLCAAYQANLDSENRSFRGTGGWLVDTEAETLLAWQWSFAGELPYIDRGEHSWQSPSTLTAWQELRSLLDQGCIWVGRDPRGIDYLVNHQALTISGSTADSKQVTAAFSFAKSSDEWLILPYPSDLKSPTLVTTGLQGTIIANSTEKDLAGWLFLQWLAADDQLLRLAATTRSLPVRESHREELLRQYGPPFEEVFELLDVSVSAPRLAPWYISAPVAADAFHQLFEPNMTSEQVPILLQMLDSTSAELIELSQ